MSYQVTQLFIYPIKGLGGISATSSFAYNIGFAHDRRYMLIDRNNQFITQRQLATLAKFKTNIVDNQIIVNFNGDVAHIPLHQNTGEEVHSKVFDDTAITLAVDPVIDQWFSHCLDQKVRLVRLKDDNSRMHISSQNNKKYAVSLADGYPYLLVGQASLEYLNQKLDQSIGVNRFRPNIVVASQYPHEEDKWNTITIGDATFQNIKPCGRCQVITINQETAIGGSEPLKTLSQYRKVGNSVFFGINLVCLQTGLIRVGDTLNFNSDKI